MAILRESAAVDPGFAVGSGNPLGGADFRHGRFSVKTCENERIGSHGGMPTGGALWIRH